MKRGLVKWSCELKKGIERTDMSCRDSRQDRSRSAVSMPDMLNLDKMAFATLMPEQRLMAAIIRRAVADLPLSRRFFQTDNGMFRLCCEALGVDPYIIIAQIEKKLKTNTKQVWMFSSASAV